MYICTHSALIKSEKNYCLKNLFLSHCLKNLFLSHLQIAITYSFNSFLKSVEVNDLIMNKKKVKKEENKKMNILSHVKF